MSGFNLRRRPRVSYCEIEEPNLDEYIFCEECADFVYEYCSIHGPLLVIPDDKVPLESNLPAYVPRAALTIPRVFLHLAPSIIPGAGVGVFSTLTLPRGVRFGPYTGTRTNDRESKYGWQLHDGNNKWSHLIDASDANASNWMRYVNCARHSCEQNLLAYQYQGQIYYRTIKIIPRFTELMVFYGSEFASLLGIDLKHYNSPPRFLKESFQPQQTQNPKDSTIQNAEESIDKTINGREENKSGTSRTNQPRDITKKKNKINKTQKVKKTLSKIVKTKSDSKELQIKESDQNNDGLNVSNNISKQNIINNNEQNPSKEIFICDTCGRDFVCKDVLTAHVKEHTPKTSSITLENINKGFDCDVSQQINTKDNIQINNIKSKPFQCKVCDFKSAYKNCFEYHIRPHTGEKPFKCTQCNKCFSQIFSLKRHTRTHTGEKPFKCTHCNSCFTSKDYLKVHIRTHTGEKPFKCTHCNSCFTSKDYLKVHIRTHTGEKPFKCTQCNKCFNEISKLKRHTRIHTGEKPFKCTQCNKCFTQITDLKRHTRTHTGEKPFKCTKCNKCFNHISNLKKHTRTHTSEKPFKCTHCNSCFTSKDYLKVHTRTHTGEKPFKCTHCNKCFNQISNLKKHTRTHTGEKPFKCTQCYHSFACKSNLNQHIRTHK